MARKIALNILKGVGVFVISILIFAAILCGYLTGSMVMIAKEAPEITADNLLSGLKQNSTIYDRNGSLIQRIETDQYREIVEYDKIPKHLVNALISSEDKRFWDHGGVDLFGMLSALRDAARKGNVRGASTITMQLARDVYLNQDVNWTRKIQEMYLSLQIEKLMTKEQILEAYLNRVYFGQNAYGVQAASRTYFSKDVSELNLAQSATLAGIVQAPSHFSLYWTYRPSQVTNERVLGETTINNEPYVAVYNPAPYERQTYVLGQMLKNGYISEEEFDEAKAFDVASTIKPAPKRADNVSSYLTDLIKDHAVYALMDTKKISDSEARKLLNYGGLKITSTVDINLQRKVQDQFSRLNEVLNGDTSGSEGPLNLDLKYDDYGNIVNGSEALQYYKKGNLLTGENEVFIPNDQYAVNQDGSLTLNSYRIRGYDEHIAIMDFYTIDDHGILRTHRVGSIPMEAKDVKVGDSRMQVTISADFLKRNPSFYKKLDGGAIALSKEFYHIDQDGTMQPQSAVTVLNTSTGEVVAIVGGREQTGAHNINRAADYPRQPGSSFKPIAVYTAVFGSGHNQGSVQDDTPYEMLNNGNGEFAWPQNVDGRYRGLMTVDEALIRSSNPVAVKWLNVIGVPTAKEYLKKYGIINAEHPDRDTFIESTEDADNNDENLAMGLGAVTRGQTTLSMAGAYQAIGNNGERVHATSILKIEDASGNVLYQNPYTKTQVLPATENYQLLQSLQHVAANDYTDFVLLDGIDTAGKTGTTDGKTDFWFVGTTPYYTTAVWVGADNGFLSLSGNSSTAAHVYDAVSETLHAGLAPKQFTRPDGLFEVTVSRLSGKLPTEESRRDPRGLMKTILVSKATEPKEYDDVSVYRNVDIRNGLLAADDTPPVFIQTRVFTKRTTPYEPWEFDGIVPEDWGYEAPTKRSTLGPVLPQSSSGSVPGQPAAPEKAPNQNNTAAPAQPAQP